MANIPSDLFLMVIIGMVFALSGREGQRRGRSVSRTRLFLWALIYSAVFPVPISIYCYAVEPDWSWMYWLDPRTIPAIFVVFVYLIYYVALAVGYFLAWDADRRSKTLGRIVMGALVACLLVFWTIFYKRAFYVGTRDEFLAGKAVMLLKVYPLSPFLIVTMTLAAAALICSSIRIFGGLKDFKAKGNH